MEKIILEVQDRSLNQYHIIEKYPVTIGRAFDNDIIISDNTISPHHLVIDQNDTGIIVENLSNENGASLNNKKLALKQATSVSLPAKLMLAQRSIRLLKPDTPIESTTINSGKGRLALFCQPIAAGLLLAFTFIVILLENYLSTEFVGTFNNYISKVIPSIWFLLVLALLALGINRAVTQRWQIWPSISIASLFVLIPPVLSEIGHWWSYFVTANWPSNVLILTNQFLVLPLLLFLCIYQLYHTSKKAALSWALLFSMPIIVFQLTNLIDDWTIQANSVSELDFNRSVRAWDMRLLPTLSQSDYMQQAREALGSAKSP
ncbi:FHA domain-containing protein [Thiofilum flexile]|uniref:FHA domain-containing protein n=1 Tax=Thiofilum flexile TaxID=125627 RepID=UPI000360AD78|nr:FHA domain-containing protein [Thiofilum flexile]